MIKLFSFPESLIETRLIRFFHSSKKISIKISAGPAVKCVLICVFVNFDYKCIQSHNPV